MQPARLVHPYQVDDLVVLWYAEAGHGSRWDVWPCRPWYRRKVSPSFEDMLWAVRRAVMSHRVADLVCSINNLRNPRRPSPHLLRDAA